METPTAPPDRMARRRAVPWLELSLLLILGLAVTVVLWHTARLERRQAIEQYQSALQTVAEGKANVAAHWLRERQLDAAVVAGLPEVRSALTGTSLSRRQHHVLAAALTTAARKYGLAGLYLISRRGEVLLATGAGRTVPSLPQRILSPSVLIRKQSTVFDDLRFRVFVSAPAQSLAAAPWQTPAPRRQGAVVFALTLKNSLWSVIRQPIRPLPGLRTLLLMPAPEGVVCIAGEQAAEFCSRAPYRNDAEARFALAARNGKSMQGSYRFRTLPELAHVARVPGTDWLVAAQLTRSEALADYRTELSSEQESGIVLLLLSAILLVAWRLRRKQEELRLELRRQQELLAERTRAAEVLRQSETRFRYLIEQSRSAVFLVGCADGRISEMNAAFFSEFQFDPVNSPELRVGDLFEGLPADAAAAAAVLRPGDAPPLPVERILRGGGGGRFLVETRSVLPPGSDGGHFYVIAREIGRQRELLRQMSQLQKMEAVGRLACGIAHDFNNLLTIIRGNAELLTLEAAQPRDVLRSASHITDAADRAAHLIHRLLAFTRQQPGELQPIELCHFLKGMDDLLRSALGSRIELRQELAREALTLRADPTELEQVVLNLTINARDAMPNGGVLRIEARRIETTESTAEATLLPAGPLILLAVHDTGVGMDAATLDHIFEPFFTTREDSGTGLGLATVYGIVQRAGGAIRVRSAPGEGSTFSLYFPAHAEVAQAAAPALEESHA